MKKIALFVCAAAMAVVMTGCFLFSPTPTKHKITTYFDDLKPLESARFFIREVMEEYFPSIEDHKDDLKYSW